MSYSNVFYPASRNKHITEQVSNLSKDERDKFYNAVSLLRIKKRPNDHKLHKLPTDYLWISDLGGRKGGRIIYLKPDEDIIIWGVGPDHCIEEEASRFFSNKIAEETLISEKRIDITTNFPTEEEIKRQAEKTYIFAGNLSDNILTEMGLSDYQISKLRESNLISIWNLNIPDYRKLEISQLSQTGTIYSVKDDAHLEKFIRGDVSRLLIHLDDYQQEIIDYHSNIPLLIKGETGTGKTTILIYKAVYYAELHKDENVVLFTYNIPLAKQIKSAIEELTDNKLINLNINAFFEWYQEALTVYNHSFDLLEKRKDIKFYDILAECYTKDDMKKFNFKELYKFNFFLKTEIETIIQDYNLNQINEYLNFERKGRSKQLGKTQRKIIWYIYINLLKKLSSKGLYTYKTLLKHFSEVQIQMSAKDKFSYNAIFLDEAQDMSPSVIKALTLLKKDSNSLIWLAGDYKQSIYRSSFRWSDVQLPFYGANVKVLRKNYRNSFQILDSAHSMLKSFIKDAEKPEHCGRQGAPVKTYYYEGKEKFQKLKGIIDYFHIKEKVHLSDIAIFSPSKIDTIFKRLSELSVPLEYVRDIGKIIKDSVKVSTLHSAKGLEFRVVIIIDTQTKLLYEQNSDDIEKIQQAAKLLYVGMTRAFDACCFLLNKERDLGLIMDKVVNPVKRIKVK